MTYKLTDRLIKSIEANPVAYVGTFSFAWKNERITQVLFYGKHHGSIFSRV